MSAVDISPAMTEALAERTADAGLANVSTEVTDLKDLRLPPSYADLIVSSYALHHLADADKRALTARAAQWLRPGGRLVIADMMFGRGGNFAWTRQAREADISRDFGRQGHQADRRGCSRGARVGIGLCGSAGAAGGQAVQVRGLGRTAGTDIRPCAGRTGPRGWRRQLPDR